MFKTIMQGECPKCHSHNIEYGNTELDGEYLGYEFECNECGCQATEWYKLEFEETTSDEDLKTIMQGECPKCHSQNIEYANAENDGEYRCYEFECEDCGCQATEWFKLEFEETVSYEE